MKCLFVWKQPRRTASVRAWCGTYMIVYHCRPKSASTAKSAAELLHSFNATTVHYYTTRFNSVIHSNQTYFIRDGNK